MSSSYFAPSNRSDLDDAVSAWNVNAEDAASIYGDINTWDVSAVRDFSYLFANETEFNSDISHWDVSRVLDFSYMFSGTSSFNQSISKWDVSSGTNFQYMFYDASSFNHDISKWNVSRGVNFNAMFGDAIDFNQNISKWDVSRGTNFQYMFCNASTFNQDISNWDVSRGTNFIYMFYGASSFDQDISYWPVHPGAELVSMFSHLMISNQGFDETPLATNFGQVRDTTPPSFTSAETSSNGAGVILRFDEELHSDLAEASAFKVTVDGKASSVASVDITGEDGSSVLLTLTDYIKKGQTVTVSYSDPTFEDDANALQDLVGNDVESLSKKAVTNKSTRGDHSEDDDGDSGNDGNSGDDGDSGNDEKETTPSYRGTKRNDKIKGDNKSNKIYGLKGNDWLYGKLGNDLFHGGKGRDTAQFSSRNNTIKLTTTKKQNTGDGKDRLISIENVKGGGGKDKIIGNKAKNVLNGQKGKDRLYGGKNDDILIGGGGKDKCWGQQGRDTFRIKRGAGYMIVKDFSDGKDRIQLGSGHKGLKLKTRGDDVYVYQRKDLMAVVEDAAGDLTRKGKYLV